MNLCPAKKREKKKSRIAFFIPGGLCFKRVRRLKEKEKKSSGNWMFIVQSIYYYVIPI